MTTSADAAAPDASFMMLAQLAAALSRSFSTFAPVDTAPLTADQIETLCRQPLFRQPLERFYNWRHMGVDITLSAAQTWHLTATPSGRLTIALLVEPVSLVEQAALLVSGAAMQQQVLQTVYKPEREFLRTVLMPAAFQVAALEAPMLYPSLSRYGTEKVLADSLARDEVTARDGLIDLGMGLLTAVADTSSHSLTVLALRRLRAGYSGPSVTSLSPDDKQSIIRLLQRRMASWAAFIG